LRVQRLANRRFLPTASTFTVWFQSSANQRL
jgi:hypothetical protein